MADFFWFSDAQWARIAPLLPTDTRDSLRDLLRRRSSSRSFPEPQRADRETWKKGRPSSWQRSSGCRWRPGATDRAPDRPSETRLAAIAVAIIRSGRTRKETSRFEPTGQT